MKVSIEIGNEDRAALAEILQAAAIIGCIPDDDAGVACMITLRHVRAIRALVAAIDDAVIEAERAEERSCSSPFSGEQVERVNAYARKFLLEKKARAK